MPGSEQIQSLFKSPLFYGKVIGGSVAILGICTVAFGAITLYAVLANLHFLQPIAFFGSLGASGFLFGGTISLVVGSGGVIVCFIFKKKKPALEDPSIAPPNPKPDIPNSFETVSATDRSRELEEEKQRLATIIKETQEKKDELKKQAEAEAKRVAEEKKIAPPTDSVILSTTSAVEDLSSVKPPKTDKESREEEKILLRKRLEELINRKKEQPSPKPLIPSTLEIKPELSPLLPTGDTSSSVSLTSSTVTSSAPPPQPLPEPMPVNAPATLPNKPHPSTTVVKAKRERKRLRTLRAPPGHSGPSTAPKPSHTQAKLERQFGLSAYSDVINRLSTIKKIPETSKAKTSSEKIKNAQIAFQKFKTDYESYKQIIASSDNEDLKKHLNQIDSECNKLENYLEYREFRLEFSTLAQLTGDRKFDEAKNFLTSPKISKFVNQCPVSEIISQMRKLLEKEFEIKTTSSRVYKRTDEEEILKLHYGFYKQQQYLNILTEGTITDEFIYAESNIESYYNTVSDIHGKTEIEGKKINIFENGDCLPISFITLMHLYQKESPLQETPDQIRANIVYWLRNHIGTTFSTEGRSYGEYQQYIDRRLVDLNKEKSLTEEQRQDYKRCKDIQEKMILKGAMIQNYHKFLEDDVRKQKTKLSQLSLNGASIDEIETVKNKISRYEKTLKELGTDLFANIDKHNKEYLDLIAQPGTFLGTECFLALHHCYGVPLELLSKPQSNEKEKDNPYFLTSSARHPDDGTSFLSVAFDGNAHFTAWISLTRWENLENDVLKSWKTHDSGEGSSSTRSISHDRLILEPNVPKMQKQTITKEDLTEINKISLIEKVQNNWEVAKKLYPERTTWTKDDLNKNLGFDDLIIFNQFLTSFKITLIEKNTSEEVNKLITNLGL